MRPNELELHLSQGIKFDELVVYRGVISVQVINDPADLVFDAFVVPFELFN
jgi:hypothetical protein